MHLPDPAQRAVVASYWWQRAEGEITSWVGFRHVLEDLQAESAPSPVIALAERAVADERRHALWCRDWAARFGYPVSGDPQPRSERRVRFGGATERDNRVLRITLCCLTETVGCFILRHARRRISDPELRKLNQRHLADELRHSRVGWAYLTTLDAHGRALLLERIDELLELLPVACCEGSEQDRDDLVPFGYFSRRLLRTAHDDAVAHVIGPGLDHLRLRRAA